MATGVQTKTTLAPALGAVTAMSMGKDIKTGRVEAIEVGNQIPGQMSFADEKDTETVEVEGKKVDMNTGEIVEEKATGNNVIDLRERQA